ncbi:adipocyte plasma membrane-associated protein Hemomucin-like [Prorops nasuta]|uniref:adipocyte plasma membrane-associated protein Hemomucin-like n=1 Tax=Prorops nasuta TaxID=863751 RepID=UPI0034CF4A03
MGFLKSVGTSVIYIGLALALITFIPGLPPEARFSEISLTPTFEFNGHLGPNKRLDNAEILFAGKLKGAESFDSYNGELYSGIHGGYVIKITENDIVPIVKFGKQCDGYWQEDKCGRPLGLKFNKNGDLYVIDAYHGVFQVDVKQSKYQQIIDISKPIEGKVPKTPNSLDIANNGDIYWTDSSSDFKLYDGVYTSLADPSGRLIRYNAAKKTNEVLLKNLAFANGVILSNDESFLLVSETFGSRVRKYHLKGPGAGESTIFAQGLPGLPDNIHSDGEGGFLVSLVAYADLNHPILTQTLMPHPLIRKMLVRLLWLIELPMKYFHEAYPNVFAEKFIHAMGSFEAFSFMSNNMPLIIRFGRNGNVIETAYGSNDNLTSVSSAFIHNNYVYFGSPYAEYIARAQVQDVFPELTRTATHFRIEREVHRAGNAAKATVKKISTSNTPPSAASKPLQAQTTTTTSATTTTTTTTTPRPTTQKSTPPTTQRKTTPNTTPPSSITPTTTPPPTKAPIQKSTTPKPSVKPAVKTEAQESMPVDEGTKSKVLPMQESKAPSIEKEAKSSEQKPVKNTKVPEQKKESISKH